MHATRCTLSQALGTSLGAMVFQRDMFTNLPVVADLVSIRDRCQELINEHLHRQNVKQHEWDYAVGQE
eukprot:14810218-Ditylum_brightwellii.AAC.1